MPKADETDQYDFEDSDLEEQLIIIGKKLKALGAHPPSGKDALVKLLKVSRFRDMLRCFVTTLEHAGRCGDAVRGMRSVWGHALCS